MREWMASMKIDGDVSPIRTGYGKGWSRLAGYKCSILSH